MSHLQSTGDRAACVAEMIRAYLGWTDADFTIPKSEALLLVENL